MRQSVRRPDRDVVQPVLEAVRAGTAPAAILTTGVDAFFALASIVAGEMYGKSFPVVALEAEDFRTLKSGTMLTVALDGSIAVVDPRS